MKNVFYEITIRERKQSFTRNQVNEVQTKVEMLKAFSKKINQKSKEAFMILVSVKRLQKTFLLIVVIVN